MPDFHRYRVPGGCYFFTVNLLERRANTLLTDRTDRLRDAVPLCSIFAPPPDPSVPLRRVPPLPPRKLNLSHAIPPWVPAGHIGLYRISIAPCSLYTPLLSGTHTQILSRILSASMRAFSMKKARCGGAKSLRPRRTDSYQLTLTRFGGKSPMVLKRIFICIVPTRKVHLFTLG